MPRIGRRDDAPKLAKISEAPTQSRRGEQKNHRLSFRPQRQSQTQLCCDPGIAPTFANNVYFRIFEAAAVRFPQDRRLGQILVLSGQLNMYVSTAWMFRKALGFCSN